MRSILVVVLVIFLALVGCSSGSDDPSPTPTSSGLTPSPSPVSTPAETPVPTPTPSVTPVDTFEAIIDQVSPNPVQATREVSLSGSSNIADDQISAYKWSIEGHGAIAYKKSFTSSVITRIPGTYQVILEVQNKEGVWSARATQMLTVLPIPPAAGFSATPVFGDLPLTVRFSDLSSRVVTSRTWDFGDGNTSTEQNPSHTYTSVGNYTVSLAVEGPDGSDTEVKQNLVEVADIDFSASPTTGYLSLGSLEVSFTDKSQGDISGWTWVFGDGITSREQNPTHTYTSVGTYTVSLTVTGGNGQSASTTRTGFVSVLEPAPVADFYFKQSAVVNVPVSFTDFSHGGTSTSWQWNFGDGGTSIEQNPVHIYTAAGTYSVRLLVQGPGGSDFEEKTIVVTTQ